MTAAIKILRYLEEKELLKKTLIEGLADHIPSIQKIADESEKDNRSAIKNWISMSFNMIHSAYHIGDAKFFKDCSYPECKSAARTCEELS